jgi:protein disulfide-isomerase
MISFEFNLKDVVIYEEVRRLLREKAKFTLQIFMKINFGKIIDYTNFIKEENNMKKFKIILSATLLVGALTAMSFMNSNDVESKEVKEASVEKSATELVWHTDLNKANALAEKEGKTIFAFFTGSDWCGWCHKLQRNVFSKKEFISWADKNVILLELDFPRRKTLPADLKKQNSSLQQAFGVRGYPTIWLFNMDLDKKTGQSKIAAKGSLSYPRSEAGKEAESFIASANKVLNN